VNFSVSNLDGPLFLQQLQIAEQVLGYTFRFRLGIKGLEFLGDLLNGALAIAELNDLKARAADAHASMGEEQLPRQLILVVEANSRGEPRCGRQFRFHRVSMV